MQKLFEVVIMTIVVLLFMEMGRICIHIVTNMLNNIQELLKEKRDGR